MDEKLGRRMDPETSFLCGLLELQYGQPVEEKLRRLTLDVPWAEGWPQDTRAFWNAEAFLWKQKIPEEKRQLIARKLLSLEGSSNLDIGCGAWTYVPESVGFDLSEKMLQFNDRCSRKVIGSLEHPLPFAAGSFQSVTAIFVLNYVRHLPQLLEEIWRILGREGKMVAVTSGKNIHEWQRQKEIHSLSANQWANLFQQHHFSVKCQEDSAISFITGTKLIKGMTLPLP